MTIPLNNVITATTNQQSIRLIGLNKIFVINFTIQQSDDDDDDDNDDSNDNDDGYDDRDDDRNAL